MCRETCSSLVSSLFRRATVATLRIHPPVSDVILEIDLSHPNYFDVRLRSGCGIVVH